MIDLFTSTATIVNPQINAGINNLLTSAIQLVLLVFASGATWAIKLLINNLHSGFKEALARRLVAYAEQKLPTNEEKMKYVAEQIHSRFPRIEETEIQHLIEEAVVNLKTQLGEVTK